MTPPTALQTWSRSRWSQRMSVAQWCSTGCSRRRGPTRIEKLAESGEFQPLARRHAEYYRDLFQRAAADWGARPRAEWHADCGRRIDEVRAALNWAFSPGGEASIGVTLTIAAVPLWFALSLMGEARDHVERALLSIERGSTEDARQEMQLVAALAEVADVHQG